MTWPRPACLASTTCQVRMSTLVVDKEKTKTSLSRSSRTNILKSPANAIWQARSHLMKYGHYLTCNILPSTGKCRPRHQDYIITQVTPSNLSRNSVNARDYRQLPHLATTWPEPVLNLTAGKEVILRKPTTSQPGVPDHSTPLVP